MGKQRSRTRIQTRIPFTYVPRFCCDKYPHTRVRGRDHDLDHLLDGNLPLLQYALLCGICAVQIQTQEGCRTAVERADQEGCRTAVERAESKAPPTRRHEVLVLQW